MVPIPAYDTVVSVYDNMGKNMEYMKYMAFALLAPKPAPYSGLTWGNNAATGVTTHAAYQQLCFPVTSIESGLLYSASALAW